ncbi:MAG: alpha-amylase family glycosyl hydrolase, partial [Gemmatimonadota bacterium]|nr:alpha-amylase family glycosyl hydrolase [Gemmatimonadota bacterium]
MHRHPMLLVAALLLAASIPSAAQPAARASDWRRGATCYEIFVRSFYDSDGNGIGDLNGLTEKLDYINDGNPRTTQDLGARCIWLMPVAESPSYHGYDVSNYYRVEPDYGSSADFKRFTAAAHKRGIKVLVDLVLNHASSEHPYFQAALRDPASPYRSWFRWSATKPDQKGPWGQEVWHKSPVRDEYYYGVFWSGMPDLNYETAAVRAEANKVARFWIDSMKVDGFRLDAVPYLVETGAQLAHTAGTHKVLRDFNAYVHGRKRDAFTIGEAWDSTGTILTYYPDQLDAYFAFPASDAIINAVNSGAASKLLPEFLRFQAALPANRWSPFLRNHDQSRTLTVLGGSMARARMAATLLFTLPGLPFLYYGEEIGMAGDKPDEQIRTPMQWTRQPNAGFTRGTPWEPLQPEWAARNVEVQTSDSTSLLDLYRRLIRLRAENPALAAGELVPIAASNEAVAAYLRRDGPRAVLVVANLGQTPLSGVTLSSSAGALRAGSYTPTSLLGGAAAAALNVASDGHVQAYAPLATLAPM